MDEMWGHKPKFIVTSDRANGVICNRNLDEIANIYSDKKGTSDFHGTVSFHPVKMSQQN